MEGTSGSPGLDVYPRLVGNEIYYQNVSHKANNSLYALMLGVSQSTGTVVANHASHNHQGGIKGEFIEKGAGCALSYPVCISANLNAYTNSNWINMHPSPIGDKGHMLIVGPPGCDSVFLKFYAVGDWTHSSDCQLAEVQFMWQNYGTNSDNDVTTSLPNATFLGPVLYGSQMQTPEAVGFEISGLNRLAYASCTHAPTMTFGTLSMRVNNFGSMSDSGHIYVYGPSMIYKRNSRA